MFILNKFLSFDFGLTGVFLFIDGMVYWVISQLFGIFNSLAKAEIVSSTVYNDLAEKIEVVIGVVMLFFVASALLKALVNPDEMNKSVGKIAKNCIVSIILLAIVPVIFSYAFKFQNSIMESHVIEKLLFGNESEEYDVSQYGNEAALNVLEAFLNIQPNVANKDGVLWSDIRSGIVNSGTFQDITLMVEPVKAEKDGTSYMPLISTACGIFLIYVLISFCIDLGIRVVKLAFYQIIAPIPILIYIIPSKKATFDNWIKATLATYMEVFIRLFVMFAVVFLCKEFTSTLGDSEAGVPLFSIESVIIVMGLFAFAKQAPKLISEVMGMDSGNMKLGIGGKLAAGGAFGIGAMLGGGLTAFTRNTTHGVGNAVNRWKDVKNQKGAWNKFKAVGGALGASTLGLVGSSAAGGISGVTRSAKGGFSAKTFKDTRAAAGEGARGATTARDERKNYIATHGGFIGAMGGHVSDAKTKVLRFAGISSTEQLKGEQEKVQKTSDALKAVKDRAKSIMEKQKVERMATKSYTVSGIGSYNNLAELENDIEYAKQNKTTFNGTAVSSTQLLELQQIKVDLEKQLQKDITAGFNKLGTAIEMDKYDGDLMSAVTKLRTEVQSSYNGILQNADSIIPKVKTSLGDLEKVRENNNQILNDFITSGNIYHLLDSSDAIDDANRRLRVKLNERIIKEQENKK